MEMALGLNMNDPGAGYGGGGGWWFRNASLDMDFARNRIYGAPSFASALSITRASIGYFDSTAAVWSSFANNTLRITDRGLIVEETRTNGVRNNSAQGASAPSTLPTNWAIGQLGTAITSVTSVGVEDGIDYPDIRLSGTTSTTGLIIYPEGFSQIVAANGQAWAMSWFLKRVAGDLTNISSIQLSARMSNSGGGNLGFVGAASIVIPTTGALGASRQSTVVTLNNASTAFMTPCIIINCASGVPIDITLRIGWPQAEQATFPTTPIRTTNAAVTRAVDLISVNSQASYVGVPSGGVFVEWNSINGPIGVLRQLFTWRLDGSNFIRGDIQANNRVALSVVSGGVTQAQIVSNNPVVAGQIYKAAFAWEGGRFALRVSSSLGSPANVTSGTPPSVAAAPFNVGNSSGPLQLDEIVRRFSTFLSAPTDAQLAAMVS